MVKFLKKIPAGMMLVPILIGALINTFCPELLKIGDPTEILFTSKGMSCLLGLIIFFTGTQIKIKDLKKNLKKSFVLVATKLIVAYGLWLKLYILPIIWDGGGIRNFLCSNHFCPYKYEWCTILWNCG